MKTRSLMVMMIVGLMVIGQGFVSGAFARGPMMQRAADTTSTTTTDTTAAPMGMPDHGPGQGQMDRPPLDVLSGEAITVAGTITEITSGQRMKDDVKINTGSEVVTVCGFGPAQYWTDSGVTFPMVGDNITVNGYKVTAPDNTQIIIAAKVTIGGKELQLVDTATGRPMWDGKRPEMALTGDSVTIIGTVSEVTTRPSPPARSGSDRPAGPPSNTDGTAPGHRADAGDLKINTGTETVTIVGLGPAAYWEGLGITMPKVGDSITVNGLANTFMGTDKVVALSITMNGQTIQLVDSATNRPVWMTANNPM